MDDHASMNVKCEGSIVNIGTPEMFDCKQQVPRCVFMTESQHYSRFTAIAYPAKPDAELSLRQNRKVKPLRAGLDVEGFLFTFKRTK
jgi:hypothetical protein